MSEQVDVAYFDRDGNLCEDGDSATRMTLASGGVVHSVVDYLDADGNPTPRAVATNIVATGYDTTGTEPR